MLWGSGSQPCTAEHSTAHSTQPLVLPVTRVSTAHSPGQAHRDTKVLTHFFLFSSQTELRVVLLENHVPHFTDFSAE